MKGMSKGIGPNRLGSPNKMGHMGKSAAKIMIGRSYIGSKKSEKRFEKSQKLQARADKNTTPVSEYDPIEGKVMNSNKYTKKGMRLSKRADRVFNRAAGMTRSEARKATKSMFGK